jgi:hypothetical protein
MPDQISFWEEWEDADPDDKKGKRHYVGTKNNYTDADIVALETWAQKECTYLVYGKEVGKKTGTPHLQIYMEFKNQRSMKSIIKKLFPMWLGYRKGTPRQAAGYCKKGDAVAPEGEKNDYFFPRTVDEPDMFDDEHPWILGGEFGEISQQGKRTDIDEVVEMIVHEKRTIRDVALAHPAQYVKYHRGLRDLRTLVMEPRSLTCDPQVIVLWGPTLSGKTRDAYIKYWPDEPHYLWKPSNGQWWDGYDGQKKVIIDEFRGNGMTWTDILGMLDRNEFKPPIKGGFVQVQADKFIITSPLPPHLWYKDDERHKYDKYAQLERRLTEVIEYKGPLSSTLHHPMPEPQTSTSTSTYFPGIFGAQF